MTLGIGGILTLGFLLLVLVKRKRRSVDSKGKNGVGIGCAGLPEEVEPPDISQVREIDDNSLFFGCREMADNGIVELQVERSASVSGREIAELSQSDPSLMCESITRWDVGVSRISQGSRRFAVYLSAENSTKSWTSPSLCSAKMASESILFKTLELDPPLPPIPNLESSRISQIIDLYIHQDSQAMKY